MKMFASVKGGGGKSEAARGRVRPGGRRPGGRTRDRRPALAEDVQVDGGGLP